MKKLLIVGMATVATLSFSNFAQAATAMGKSISAQFKALEKARTNKEKDYDAIFKARTLVKNSAANDIIINAETINSALAQTTSANNLTAFAVRGKNEVAALEALVAADRVRLEKKNQSLTAEEKADLKSIDDLIKSQAELMDLLGQNAVQKGNNTAANEALAKLVSLMPRIATEFSTGERQGYIELMTNMSQKIKGGKLASEALAESLKDNKKLEQLKDCV